MIYSKRVHGGGMKIIDELYLHRTEIPYPLKGKLVVISNDNTYEDVLGIYLGSYMNLKWDPNGRFTFHTILSSTGKILNYCIATNEKIDRIIKMIE